jgi:hypothetical protein
MIWIAIAIHLILSAGLLYASWQVWMLKKTLSATVNTIDGWTEACQDGLQVSSPSLEVARDGVIAVRKQYQAVEIKLEKFRELLSILNRGVSFVSSRWKQARKGSSSSPNNKLINKSSGRKSSRSKNNVKRRR